MPKPVGTFVLTHIIEKVSEMSDDRQISVPVEHFHVPWKLGFIKSDGQFMAHLFCVKERADTVWSVKTKYNFKAMSVHGKSFNFDLSYTFGNTSDYAGYGSAVFSNWDGMLKEFVVDDRMVFEVHVTIEEMEGIEKPAKLKNFGIAAKPFSDVVLKVEGQKFYVSKLTLSSQSTYFASLFMGKFKEAKKSEVTLKDIDKDDFQTFLEVLHLEPSLTDSNVEDVIKLMDMYDAKNGARICEEYLMKDSKHSLKTKLRIAAQYKFEKLKKHCLDCMTSSAHVRSVMGPDLYQLDPNVCSELLEKSLALK